ncbi:MAG TPA: hypothetical protein VM432_01510 [Bdellovibrionales bacterium]|nr:hypothetical protein [Bdellovibrionales bacterium]
MSASIYALLPRLDRFFKSNKLGSFEIVSNAMYRPMGKRVENVVLIGDGPKVLYNSAVWPKQQSFHIWTLSTAMNRLVSNLLGFEYPNAFVSTIPRYELYPASRKKYDIHRSDSFVYAGRDTIGKNLPLLVDLVSELRKSKFRRHRLHIFGPGRKPKFMNQSWIVWHGDHGTEWTSRLTGRPAFISLSHYAFEDFSVAAAEAEVAGMPVVVPKWFGFKDIDHRGNVLLSGSLVSQHVRKRRELVKKWCREIQHRQSVESVPKVERTERRSRMTYAKVQRLLRKNAENIDIEANVFFAKTHAWNNYGRFPSVMQHLLSVPVTSNSVTKRLRHSRSGNNVSLDARWSLNPIMRIRVITENDNEILLFNRKERSFMIVDGLARDLVCSVGGNSTLRSLIHFYRPRLLNSRKGVGEAVELVESLRDNGVLLRSEKTGRS